jgi:hypothetical protein
MSRQVASAVFPKELGVVLLLTSNQQKLYCTHLQRLATIGSLVAALASVALHNILAMWLVWAYDFEAQAAGEHLSSSTLLVNVCELHDGMLAVKYLSGVSHTDPRQCLARGEAQA